MSQAGAFTSFSASCSRMTCGSAQNSRKGLSRHAAGHSFPTLAPPMWPSQLLQARSCSHGGPALQRASCLASSAAEPPETEALTGLGEVVNVKSLKGVKVLVDGNGRPVVEYLVEWEDGHPETWEPKENIADNLLRDFEERWWTACRNSDDDTIKEMLRGGARVLCHAVDENRRGALHFCAATGNTRCTKLLLDAGADPNLQDKDGYTPLHMAAGYLHTGVVGLMMQYAADPEIKDAQGRSVTQLVADLKAGMPLAAELVQRRYALEKVEEIVVDSLYEEVPPACILDARTNEDGSRDFLVQWPDGAEDSWVAQRDVAEDVIEDYDRGLEYAQAERILDVKRKGDAREYLIRWADGYHDSWEDEDGVSPFLVAAWEAEQNGKTLEISSLNGMLELPQSGHAANGSQQEGAAQAEAVAALS